MNGGLGGLLILIIFLLAIGTLNWFMLRELGRLDGDEHDDWFEKVHDWVVTHLARPRS